MPVRDPHNLHFLHYKRGRILETNHWVFEELFYLVVARVQIASAEELLLEIPVCSPTRPIMNHHPIKHSSGGSWFISPAVYQPSAAAKTWFSVSRPVHESLGMTFLVLSDAPSEVDEQFATLEVPVL